MHKLHAAVGLVSQFNIMDKTLKDYINRTRRKLEEDKDKPMTPNPNQYLVYPKQEKEEDKPINPYGQH